MISKTCKEIRYGLSKLVSRWSGGVPGIESVQQKASSAQRSAAQHSTEWQSDGLIV